MFCTILLLSELPHCSQHHLPSGRLTERLMEELDRQLLHLVRVAQPEDFKSFLRLSQNLEVALSSMND